MDARLLDMLGQIAKGIAAQFGPNCEVVVHEISDKSAYSSIVAIENGHVSGRKVGDGPSHVVLEQIGHDDDQVSDQLCYLTRTKDGKTLKSSSVYIHDEHGKVAAILGINYDISMMQMFENTLHEFNSVDAQTRKEPERITLNVADLLEDLIRQADELVGKISSSGFRKWTSPVATTIFPRASPRRTTVRLYSRSCSTSLAIPLESINILFARG